MPAPTASQIEPIAKAALQRAGIRSDNAADLAKVLAQVTGQGLTMFLAQAMVMPGIPAVAPPLPFSGATVGPGMLAPPPVGGPGASQLEPIAAAAVTQAGLKGKDAPALGRAIAGALAQAILLFTSQVQVMPGIPIAGLVTTAPGRLM